MATRKSAKKPAPKSAKRSPAKGKSFKGFTDDERAAMREHVQELKAAARRGHADDESGVLAKIAIMPAPDRDMARRIHAIVKASAPHLTSRLWYSMPAYAKDDKVVIYFQGAYRFKARYGTLGFSDKAPLDEGRMWPIAFAVTELTPAEEAQIAALVKKAAS